MTEEDLNTILSAAVISLIGGALMLVLFTGIFGEDTSVAETCSCYTSTTCACQNS